MAVFNNRLQRWRRGRSRSGSVILIVLITVLFAASALTLFIEKASNDLLVEAREADASRLRMEAYSALETTLGTLEDFRQVLGGLHSPAEGWGDPLAFAHYEPPPGMRIDVGFEDESAKISLPNVDATTLTQLFEGWNMTQANAEKLRDALLGWMHSDYVGASAGSPRPEDYDHGDLPITPPGRSLKSFSELGSIQYARDVFYDENGLPNDLWRRFAATFSLYSYKQPNINGGNPNIFLSLGIQDKTQIKLVQDYLAGVAAHQMQTTPGLPYFKTSQDIAGLLGANSPAVALGTQIMALRVIITVHQGPSQYRLAVLVAPQGGATVPTPPSNSLASTLATTTAQKPNAQQNTATNAGATASSTAGPNGVGTVQAFPRATTSANGGVNASLNYPFTILEIRENDPANSVQADLKG
jgi:general secretion pathway protein K